MNGNLFVFRPRGNPGRERLQRLAIAHERHVRRGWRKMLEFDDSLIAPSAPLPDSGRKLAHPHGRRPDHDREPRRLAGVRYGRQVGLFLLQNCFFGMPTPGRSEASPLTAGTARNREPRFQHAERSGAMQWHFELHPRPVGDYEWILRW